MIETSWARLKNLIDTKGLSIQYLEEDSVYFLWAVDGALIIECELIQDGGADVTDFEDNYLSSANFRINPLGQAVMDESSPVVIASNQSAIPVTQSGDWEIETAPAETGTVTNTTVTGNNHVDFDVLGSAAALLQITGTWSGQLQFRFTNDSTNFENLSAVDYILLDGQNYSETTANGVFRFNVGGMETVRVIAAGLGAGVANLNFGTSVSPAFIDHISGYVFTKTDVTASVLPTGASIEAKQDTGNTSLSSIDTKLTTTNNSLAAIDAGTPAALGQTTMSASMPVAIASNQSAIPTSQSGTWTVQPGNTANTTAWKVDGSAVTQPVSNSDITAIKTAVEIMDDWDESDRAKVNTISGQVGVQGASGAVSANTQRVVLATDVALPAGTNAIGKLAANSGIDIGDVDVTSLVPGTGASSLGKAEDAGHTTGDVGVMSLAVRNDANASFTNTDLDYSPIAVDIAGRAKVVQETSVKPTYASAIVNLATAATATDVFTLTGSASKTIRVIEIGMSGSGTAVVVPVALIKRSAANTTGTSTSPAVVPHDSGSAAGTGVVRAYTANPSALGAAVGTIKSYKMLIDAATVQSNMVLYQHGASPSQPIVLRGTSELLAISLNSTTITGSSMCFHIVWTEE